MELQYSCSVHSNTLVYEALHRHRHHCFLASRTHSENRTMVWAKGEHIFAATYFKKASLFLSFNFLSKSNFSISAPNGIADLKAEWYFSLGYICYRNFSKINICIGVVHEFSTFQCWNMIDKHPAWKIHEIFPLHQNKSTRLTEESRFVQSGISQNYFLYPIILHRFARDLSAHPNWLPFAFSRECEPFRSWLSFYSSSEKSRPISWVMRGRKSGKIWTRRAPWYSQRFSILWCVIPPEIQIRLISGWTRGQQNQATIGRNKEWARRGPDRTFPCAIPYPGSFHSFYHNSCYSHFPQSHHNSSSCNDSINPSFYNWPTRHNCSSRTSNSGNRDFYCSNHNKVWHCLLSGKSAGKRQKWISDNSAFVFTCMGYRHHILFGRHIRRLIVYNRCCCETASTNGIISQTSNTV